MNRILFYFFILSTLNSCHIDRTLLGDWEARGSSGDYAEFAVYDNFIRIYTDVAGQIPTWDYKIVGDTLQTPILNYKIEWIKKDSAVLRNAKFTIELRRINGGVCLSEVEGDAADNHEFIDSFYNRRGEK